MRQYVPQLTAAVLRQFALKPRVQLLRRQARLQVQRHVRLRQIFRQVAGHRERQRPGNAEMREQHLTQIRVQHLLALFQRQGDILERQPLQTPAPVAIRFNRGQHAHARGRRVPDALRQTIAVARRTRQRAG